MVENLEGKLLCDNKPVDKNIYERLKLLEDRVLFLEGISPEYFSNHSQSNSILNNQKKNDDELTSINLRIQSLQQSIRKVDSNLQQNQSIKQEKNDDESTSQLKQSM